MELVGRDGELRAVARAFDDVRDGGARVLAVLGEAGIGKSALLAAIAEQARASARPALLVLEGRAAEHERDLPFAVAIDALDEHVASLHPSRIAALDGELGAILPAATSSEARVGCDRDPVERFRYLRALRGLLELLGRERPFALLLDDLHWSDDMSLEFVLHVLRRPPAVPHLIAFALRPGTSTGRLLDAARGAPGFEQLALAPLRHDESLGLLADVRDPAVRERLAREAGGNPLYLRELARVADRPGGGLPATVVAAVGVEIAALPSAARTLIEGAAVTGDPFDPELAAAAAGVEPDAAVLDRLVAADLVRPSSGTPSCGFAFRHPLVRRAVYDAAPPAWRLAAHERAAAVLERRGAAAVARAYHVARFARPADDAAIALLAEAAAATADTAPATSAHYYAAALQLVPDADAGRRASLLAPMARALTGAGRLADGRTTLLEVLDLLGPEPTAQRLELVVTCAQVETELGLHGEARRRLLAALAEAPPDGHAALTFELAVAAFHGGDGDELRERSHAATRAATAADDPLLLAGAEALAAVGALRLADAAGAHGALGRAEARLAELDDATLATRPTVLWNLALAQLFGDRFADAAATSARALTIVRRTGPGLASPLLALRAVALHHLLDLDAALREIETAEEIARLQRVPRHLHLALSVRGAVQYDRGEVADAERVADECAGLQRELEASHMTRIGDSGLAATRVERDPARAIRDIVAAAGPRLEGAEPACRSWLLLQLVRAGVATGALADAERWAGEAAEAAVELRLPTSEARSTMARAEFLLARRDAAAAAALAERAVALAEGAPAPLDAADARLLAGRAHAAAGDTQRAKAALQQAAADAGRGGAVRLRDAAARELRRLGTRVSAESRRAAGPQRLTDRERRIAALVADGYSNKQAAATLFLSEKTIEGALTRVYAKLGVRSRTQLQRRLAAQSR